MDQSDVEEHMQTKTVLIGATGSVASIKIPIILERLTTSNQIPSTWKIEAKLVATDKALHFFDPKTLSVPVYRDQDEWEAWKGRNDPILHIELRRWASMMVICPLDANTLAKLSTGICDNLLTCVVRAWDLARPLLFAPAMNTHMWEHPVTARQVDILKGFGYKEIPCIEKTLACGDSGFGAMAEVDTIVSTIVNTLKELELKGTQA